MLRKIKQAIGRKSRERQIEKQVEIIRQSAFFDGEWYLRNHIELQDKGIDPARDYLLNGVPWKNPSGLFSSLEYWHLHPDAAEKGINPLVHYETSGKPQGMHINTLEHDGQAVEYAAAIEGHPTISIEGHQKSFDSKLESLRLKVQEGQKIRVVFLVSSVSMFSLKPLFELMLEDDLFEPTIFAIPDFRKPDYETNMQRCKTELIMAGCPEETVAEAKCNDWIDWDDVCIGADIVAYDLPYYNITAFRYTPFYATGRKFLPIIANYTYPNSMYDRRLLSLDSYSYMWKVFFECEDTIEEYRKNSGINGANASLTGYIKMDPMSQYSRNSSPRKKVLVALHHSIDGGANDLLGSANFIRYFDYLCSLPDKYPELDFIYRPHPFLFNSLKIADDWNDGQIKAFIRSMEEKPNFEWSLGGEYLELFAQSDACIQDCGSFLVEYLYTGNPCCYMLKHPTDIKMKFAPLGQQCLEHYYLSFNTDSIDQFITEVVIGGNDIMAETRREFSKKVMFNYPHAANAALEDIKNAIIG